MPQLAEPLLFNTITFLTSQLLPLLPHLYHHLNDNNAIAMGTLVLENFPCPLIPPLYFMSLQHATCSFFRQPANFTPDFSLSLSEIAAFDMCQKRAIFRPMTTEQKQELKQICGDSWKLVLRFLLAGEACSRREKSQAVAGPGHSIAVTSKGVVYSFGSNNSGQLGHGTTEEQWRPCPIRSLQGIRIIQAACGAGRTMLISDSGQVYAFGKDSFGEAEIGAQGPKIVTTPLLVESLKNIFVVQAVIGNFFTAVLSREGRVYTFSWGSDARLGHHTDLNDKQPHPLLGALEHIPVVQIAAGYCYLLCLACQPSGMSVYSVGCGLGGKLGHGSRTDEKYPRLIEQFQNLNLQPMVVAAGAWHAAIVGQDGRVCTWGWGRYGCLGHGNEDCESVPKVVEALSDVKAVHVATGDYTTFVVSDNGDVYSFGCGESSSLGHNAGNDDGQGNGHSNVLSPKLVTSLKQKNERVVQISLTNSIYWNAHTFALTESGKLYAFGAGDKGQLGIELTANQTERGKPERVDIDLS
ncbi:ultraviolet-B receptor UVR8-like isoform X2 [Prosopis cineraria]|uniref:ultraviolet-B receptor UVR8-like isoform X2 n=1 Tax=Prosopis cineraria TaxID=364024 RepID=UPI00240F5D13|nr:ultraviolet-B receptor UVR8-like isoform X2 [Prosopis cineraria]XP_054786910.1 ultraviolet-B receptor UVR8-like isoform X2 [Prosopis cineraria]XP_054786911.1 ultraviolet-B receptor UVR8-like isoform X2 [Prosopis cineraria]XP_054790796.1 ultraviolet-B receptor UVR8-like isoform X2 [Prosopis cineraria]XP_054790798.1 ultraviolet-B receptor UVR8-like isoform X2 [Prosopis cineraria]XP_054790799.1 ultraviolet-B receptor UVR8-like isoform X2 [Prosopis cineraria]